MTRRTRIGLGTALVLVGLTLIYNVGLASLLSSSVFWDHDLSDPLTIELSSHAVVTDDLDLLRRNNMPDFVSPRDDVRVEGVAAESGTIFLGVGPAGAVDAYLDGVAHDEITEWDSSADDIIDVVYTANEGTTDPVAPERLDFWVASVSGTGEQTLDWTIEPGEWALVIMNADGSPGIAADVRFGVATPFFLFPVGMVSLIVGSAASVVGGRMVTSVPARPDETPRWTLRGRSVLPTTVEGSVAVLCVLSLFVFLGYTSGTMFGAPIFLFLARRKGDRGLLLVLPLLASLFVVALIGLLTAGILFG